MYGMLYHTVYRRQQLNEVKDCKVVNGESGAAQNRVLVLDCEIKCSKKRIPEQGDIKDQMVETERREPKDTV